MTLVILICAHSPLIFNPDALDTRPLVILPFANHIASFTYDSKHDHLAVALRTGTICILERTTGTRPSPRTNSNLLVFLPGINDLPSIQHVSDAPIVDIHPLQTPPSQTSNENLGKSNGFVLLSTDGRIYRAKFQSTSSEQTYDLDRNVTRCFPQ